MTLAETSNRFWGFNLPEQITAKNNDFVMPQLAKSIVMITVQS